MIENGLWTGTATIQESGFVVNTTCWNCGGKGHRASDCPSKKIGGTPASGGNSVSNQGDKPRGKWSAPRNGEPDTKEIFGKPYKYNTTTKRWDKQAKDILGMAKVAAETLDTEPTACVASFASVIQGGTKDAFNKFSY